MSHDTQCPGALHVKPFDPEQYLIRTWHWPPPAKESASTSSRRDSTTCSCGACYVLSSPLTLHDVANVCHRIPSSATLSFITSTIEDLYKFEFRDAMSS